MSSSTSATSSDAFPAATTWVGSGGGGVSSSLYLFTFLITIVVLGLISGGLLLRAYYVRRQFQRRVEEAIRAGQPLPDDAAAALGFRQFGNNRNKKEKKHGPMPGMWEAEMWRDGQTWEVGKTEKGEWDDITPLCVTHAAPEIPPPPPVDPATLLPQRRGPWFLRPFLTPRLPDLTAYVAAHPSPNRPGLARTATAVTLPPVVPAWTIPDDGEQVTIGVLIAMPVEGKAEERWDLKGDEDEPEESEVPEVCLGVMAQNVRNQGY